MPRVSVITIFLDAEAYLAEAVESVRSQTWDDWELLLIDDGSSDRSSAIARDAAASDPRIRCLGHPDGANRGMSASRNLGLRTAAGDLVAFLDADDVYLPDRLRHHVELLDGQPEAGLAYGPQTLWWSWDDAAGQADLVYRTHEPIGTLLTPPRLFHDYLLGRAPTPTTCSITVRRSVMEEVGGFEDEFTGMFEDQVAFLKLALHASAVVTDRPLDRYRQHPRSTTARALDTGTWSRTDPRNRSQESLLGWLERYLGDLDHPHGRAARRTVRRVRFRQRMASRRFTDKVQRRVVRSSVERRRRRVAAGNERRRR